METLRTGTLDDILLHLIDRHGDDVLKTLLCGEAQSVKQLEEDAARLLAVRRAGSD